MTLHAVEESLGRENQYGTETLGNELLVLSLGIHIDIIGLYVNFKFFNYK